MMRALKVTFVFGFLLVASLPTTVFAIPVNLAPGGTASASSEAFGSVSADGNDGNRNGAFGDGSVWHSLDPDTAVFYEVDLGADFYLDRVQVFPRTDSSQLSVENFRIDVFDNGGGNVFSDIYQADASTRDLPWGTSDVRGVLGQRVRITRLDDTPSFMTFAEFEVFGQTTRIGTNLALGGTATGTNQRADALFEDAIDGDINGIFGQADTSGIGNPNNPIYHSATNEVGNFWQVDLGSEQALASANVFARTDFQGNTSDVTFEVLADDGSTVNFTQNLQLFGTDLGGQRYDTVVDLTGVDGRFVKITSNQGGENFALALAEVEVIGTFDANLHVGGESIIGPLALAGTIDVPQLTGRVVRVIQNDPTTAPGGGGSSGGFLTIGEFQIFPDGSTTNVALAGAASASTENAFGPFPATNMIDDDIATFLHTEGADGLPGSGVSQDQFAQITLAADTLLGSVEIEPRVGQNLLGDLTLEVYSDESATNLIYTELIGSPGGASPAVSDFSNVPGGTATATLSSTRVYQVELDGASGQSDQIGIPLGIADSTELIVTGDLVVSILGADPTLGQMFQILSADVISGSFGSVTLPAIAGGLSLDDSQLLIDGTLTVVPEPSSALLVLFALLSCLVAPRRRRS